MRWLVKYLNYAMLGLLSFCVSVIASDKSSIINLQEANELAADVMNTNALHRAVFICEKRLDKNLRDFEAKVLLSRLCWSLGNHQKERDDQKNWFERGRDLGEEAKEEFPDKVEGYYWFAVNYGEWVDRASIFSKIGAKKVIVENMEKVLALDESYDSGGAFIALGRINYIAPGGSYAKAVKYYERAIELEPNRTTAYLYLGELYLHEHIFEKASKNLHAVESIEVNPRYLIEARDDRIAVKKLLRKLEKKDDNFPDQETITGR
jgi:tetratricopeptide (TPR) repeat protein